jgi:hypothetical protein
MPVLRYPLLGSLVLTACASELPSGAAEEQPSAPIVLRAAAGRARIKTYDDLLLEIGTQVPAFAGFSANADQTVSVLWADSSKQRIRVSDSDVTALEDWSRRLKWDDRLQIRASDVDVSMRYRAADLIRARTLVEDEIASKLGTRLRSTDFNEVANTVDIEVTDEAAAELVRREAQRLGRLSRAFRVSIAPEDRAFQTLQDNVPPIRGGMSISSVPGLFDCTIGPPISQYYGLSSSLYDDVVLTNSHCTSAINGLGMNGGDSIYQAGRYIGRETGDLSARTGIAGCPRRTLCRYADLAVITVGSQFSPNDPWRLNTIANTGAPHQQFGWPYPISIVDQDTVVAINPNYLPVNAIVRKQGAHTGTTQGPVSRTCVNRPSLILGGITLVCQYGVDAHAGSGDSGSPVYSWVANPPWLGGNATLSGVVWGGIQGNINFFWFSPMPGVLAEAPYLFDR